MSTELAIIKSENIAPIIQATPQSYNDNRTSHDRCLAACQQLLATIKQNGMTDELDQQAANYIDKSRRTFKVMNERRSPVTKLFDEVRTAFTSLENDIDPTRRDTVPYQLQQLRNQYAAKKHAELLERQRKEAERQRKEAELNKYKSDVEADLRAKCSVHLMSYLESLINLDAAITLDNFQESEEKIKNTDTKLSTSFIDSLHSTISLPMSLTSQEASSIEATIKENIISRFKDHYTTNVIAKRDYIIDRLPSKHRELETLANANKEEAERIKTEKAERERKEAEELKQAELKRQEEERQQAELKKQQQSMQDLFAAQATVEGYAPKSKVTKKIHLLNSEGILPILSLWFTKEGATLSPEELSKKFKFAITYCEKLANKEGVTLDDENIEYIDEVKAK